MRKTMRKNSLRIAVVSAAAASASVYAFGIAGPAEAATDDCTWYLGHVGYNVGERSRDACTKAAGNYLGEGWAYCDDDLRALGVHPNHSSEACWRGGW
ncbi:hypothetical protein [Nocardia abscessus]|uniref:hypothetical protein n=1 Tax=Nocardia abscessus TaxID=120957 RepID=UPI002453A2D0|nr:hypothetical protein [Nocardia abscessus]